MPGRGGELAREARIQEEGERDEDQPGEQPAREVDGRELVADDVADADQRGRDRRRRRDDRAAMADLAERRARGVEVLDHRGGQLLDELDRLLKEPEASAVLEDLQQHAETHGAEDVLGAGFAALSGLDDLGAGAALGEGQPAVDGERAAQEDDEEDAEETADQQDERRLPVVELGPEPLAADRDHDERRNREDGAGDQRLADRGGGSGDVLLEHAAAHERQSEGRDREHRGGESRRDGLPRLDPQVGVGRPQHRGHQHAEHDGLDRELRHVRVGRNVGLEVLLHSHFPFSAIRSAQTRPILLRKPCRSESARDDLRLGRFGPPAPRALQREERCV